MGRPGRRGWSLARQLLVLQVLIVAVLAAAGAVYAYLAAVRATDDSARAETTAVALSVAASPSVRVALREEDPSVRLQPFAERVRADTGVDFVTIMSTAGIRYTHPDPERIGGPFLGNTAQARAGRVHTETYTGTLGPSVRAVVPVFDDQRRVVAMVSAGITVAAITAELERRLVPLFIGAGLVLAVGIAGVSLISARLRRQTHGVGPSELARMFSYYEAILHAVREGLVLVGTDGRVGLCNDGARELLGLAETPEPGTPVTELGLPEDLAAALISGDARTDEIHVTEDRVVVLNVSPVRAGERSMGNVVTLRDHTELENLSGELDSVRGFAESLRAQAHESANRLHTVVSLVELGRPEDAVEFATAELELAQRLTDRVMGAVSEPIVAALLLGKAAEAAERGVELELADGAYITDPGIVGEHRIAPGDVVTVLGNLVDNAVEAAGAGVGGNGSPRVTVDVRGSDAELVLKVSDNGGGVPEEARAAVFRRGWSTKSGTARGLGLALVGQVARRYGGTVDVGEDDGAVFTVRLPVPSPEEGP